MNNKKKWASILTIATSLILCMIATFSLTLAFFGGNSTASLGTITLKTGVKVGASVTATDNTTKVVPGQQIEINATGTVEPYSSEGTVTSALLRVKFEVGGTMTVTPVFDTAQSITLKTADGDKTGYWVNGDDGYYYLCSTTANATVGNTTLLRFTPVNTTTDSNKTKAVLAGDFQVPTTLTNADSGKDLTVSATFEVIQGEIYVGTSSTPLTDAQLTIANTNVQSVFGELGGSGATEALYQRITEDGKDYILFGSYPQTIKASNVTITSDPVDENGYYTGSDGEKYAMLSANPNGTTSQYTLSDGTTMTEGSNYYFKVEPLKWRILDENEETGQALLVCDVLLEGLAYQPNYTNTNSTYYIDSANAPAGSYASSAPANTYANNYKYSNLRWVLNNAFLNSAFTTAENGIILTTEVDNSVESTGQSSNPYVCENTNDKVFALSVAELTNSDYGFNSDPETQDTNRSWLVTDYGKASGAHVHNSTGYVGTGYVWSRSPHCIIARSAYIAYIGYAGSNPNVYSTPSGVVPALNITL